MVLIRISIGIIYLWFGILKFFPNISPAETIARQTIDKLTFGYIPADVNYLLLAIMETTIGILLIGNVWKNKVIPIALVHLILTFSPMVLFTSETFSSPFVPTFVGQYIVKNLVLFNALLLLNRRNCCVITKKYPRSIV